MTRQEIEKLKEMTNTYILAKAHMETITQMAEEIQANVLRDHVFYESSEIAEMCAKRGREYTIQRITKPTNAYYMAEEDFKKYLMLCHAEYVKAGIDDKRGYSYCPEAEATDLCVAAEKAMIEYAIDILPDNVFGVNINKGSFHDGMKNLKFRERFINIILRMTA